MNADWQPQMNADDACVCATVTRYIVEESFAPTVEVLAARLDCPEEEIKAALQRLNESHGLVLHPNSDTISMAHPFRWRPRRSG